MTRQTTGPDADTGPDNQTLPIAAGVLAHSIVPDLSAKRSLLRAILMRIDWAEPVRRRAVQDAIASALVETWMWRAYTFHDARPRPGDYTGRATPAEIAAADQRCADVALACRNHADALAAAWFE